MINLGLILFNNYRLLHIIWFYSPSWHNTRHKPEERKTNQTLFTCWDRINIIMPLLFLGNTGNTVYLWELWALSSSQKDTQVSDLSGRQFKLSQNKTPKCWTLYTASEIGENRMNCSRFYLSSILKITHLEAVTSWATASRYIWDDTEIKFFMVTWNTKC